MVDLMATDEDEKVFVKDEKLTIRDYETEEEDIVSYFENLEKGTDLEEALEKVLKIGVIASKSSQVGSQVDYIQNKINVIQTKIEEQFGEQGQKIVDAIQQLKMELGISKAVDTEHQKGTQKGVEFEEYCENIISDIAKVYGDKLEATGNTTGLIAMGFGYKSHANGSYGGAAGSTCDDMESEDEDSCVPDGAGDGGVWVAATEDMWSAAKGAASSWISLPTWTFAVESAMTDWATARVGVNAGYVLMGTANAGGTAKDVTTRGGTETSFSVGLGFNYGSFNLDVDVSEGLFTNPVQHVTGYESIAPDNATATLTYVW